MTDSHLSSLVETGSPKGSEPSPLEAVEQQSITALDSQRRRDGMRVFPTLLVVGNAAEISPLPQSRLVPFQTVLHIGRRAPANTPDQTWVVKDPLISSQHCMIARGKEGPFLLTDLGSRNGTVVDGQLVKEPVKLRDGAIIFVGTQVAVFRTLTQVELDAMGAELQSPLGPVPTASPGFATTCLMLRKLASSECEILLSGETGVGKEVYARAIHAISRRKGRLVAINCAALPRELIESELFGYVRGSHSQARETKRGLFEEADGGTLFLDEIGEMPVELQTKLLRFLQDREIMPLGATKPRRLDVRILAATNRSASVTGSGLGLRADLTARLGAEPIRLPALRHRIEDVGELAAHFLRGSDCRFDPIAFQALTLHNWPGNVRELEKVLTNAQILARGSNAIGLDHLPTAIALGPDRIKASPAGAMVRPPPPTGPDLEELLRRFNGNVLRVARELGRTPPLIYKWCKRFQINPDSFRPKD